MTRLFAGTPFDIPPTCDDCGKLQSECVCTEEDRQAAEAARKRQRDRLRPDQQTAGVTVQKRKGGRKVTVIQGLSSKANDLNEILRQLQNACGTGGTVKLKEDTIELQGDHSSGVCNSLRDIGFKVRTS